MVKNQMKSVMENNINVRNRQYGTNRTIVPGYLDKPVLDIAVIMDVSGSCADPRTQGLFVNEVTAMQKAGSNATIYYTDQEVEHVQPIGTKPFRWEDYEGVGGGGTHLDNGIKRAIADGFKIIIMLSDCWMNFDMKKGEFKGAKVICASNTDDKMPAHYGPTIRINEGQY